MPVRRAGFWQLEIPRQRVVGRHLVLPAAFLSGTYPNPGFAASLPSATFGSSATITLPDSATATSSGIAGLTGPRLTSAAVVNWNSDLLLSVVKALPLLD